eukprot:GDKH01001741.1.p2 GENE.GDKH01001741.1~~GDKH01001741.1.p2  ORF type:complete len:58 (-),score=0.28 GDKH01001741.1:42-215(-)
MKIKRNQTNYLADPGVAAEQATRHTHRGQRPSALSSPSRKQFGTLHTPGRKPARIKI